MKIVHLSVQGGVAHMSNPNCDCQVCPPKAGAGAGAGEGGGEEEVGYVYLLKVHCVNRQTGLHLVQQLVQCPLS